jgi:predicted SprT family Zn-dependent metalloprotease
MEGNNIMQLETEKLTHLYNQCLNELVSIGIDIKNQELIGNIDIKLAKRANKRYGCCKQENPDEKYKIIQKRGYHKIIKYEKFQSHHIEISNWVMKLNNDIIKNTIMHELIHCIPFCNNHGKEFKKYANYINEKLDYHITTKGNIEEDYKASQLEYVEVNDYKYKIQCRNCGQVIYRKRFNPSLIKRYRCGKCKGKLKLEQEK